MKRKLKAGTTSLILPIVIRDTSSTTGAGLGSLVYNSAGLTAKYKRLGQSSWTTVSLVTMTAGTYTSGGFVASDSGAGGGYEFCPPDAAIAAGARGVIIELYGATNMLAVRIEIELDAVDYQDATAMGLSNLDAAITTRSSHTAANVRTEVDANSTQLAALVSRLTSARAGYLDYLNIGGPVASYAYLLNFFRLALRKDSWLSSDLASYLTTLNADTGGGAGSFSQTTDSQQGSFDNLPAALEAAILDEGDATALLAAIAAKVEEFLVNDGDATATLAAIATAVWSATTRRLSDGTNIVLAKGTGITGFNDLDSTASQAAAAAALTAYDPPTRTEASSDKQEILDVLGTPAGDSIADDISNVSGGEGSTVNVTTESTVIISETE